MGTERLYSPLEFYVHNPSEEKRNGEYGENVLYDRQYKISDLDAAEYMDAIELAFRRDRDTLDKARGMAEYLDGPLSGKVTSLFPDFEDIGGMIVCTADVMLSEPLTAEEMAELKGWWSGQLSDGWGEGFEQRGIKVGDGDELYVVPWSPDDGFFLETEREFYQRLGLEPDAAEQGTVLETPTAEQKTILETSTAEQETVPKTPTADKETVLKTPVQKALDEPDASDNAAVAALREQLMDRLDADMSSCLDGLEKNAFFSDGESAEITAMFNAYHYLTYMHNYHPSEIEYLLRFKEPLKVAADEFERNAAAENRSSIMWDIFHGQKALQNGRHALAPEASGPVKNATGHAETADNEQPAIVTAKLYSPVFVDLWESDEYGSCDGGPEELSQQAAAYYKREISAMLLEERTPEEAKRGLMAYYGELDAINEKVQSLFVDVEVHGGKLWAVASVELTKQLTPDELGALREYIIGQYADGFGEGFEQRDINIEGVELNVHLWKHGEFYIETQEQFSQRIGIAFPPDALSGEADALDAVDVAGDLDAAGHTAMAPVTLPDTTGKRDAAGYAAGIPATLPDLTGRGDADVPTAITPVTLPDPTGRGYIFASTDESESYIPDALHIERDDSMMAFDNDGDAAEAAKRDGVPFIVGMEGVPDNLYIDTPENREAIGLYFFTESRQQLIGRAQQNWDDYRNAPHGATSENIYNQSVSVVGSRDAFIFIKTYENFTAEEVNCLLQFADPVGLVAGYLDPGSAIGDMPGILASIIDGQENLKRHYALAAGPSVPETLETLPKAAETGEKPSVLDRIRQAEREKKERPSPPKGTPGHMKCGPEL